MSNELLSYFNDELTYLRQSGQEFANQHPNIASSLKLSEHDIQDPYINRLVQSFAFLTARIRHRLDDDYAEVSKSLLDILYPHYQLPIPSLCITQFNPQDTLSSAHSIARHTEIATETAQGITCQFRTCHPLTLLPIEIEQISYQHILPESHASHTTSRSKSRLSMSIKKLSDSFKLSDIADSGIQLYINLPMHLAQQCYQLFFQSLNAIQITHNRQSKRSNAKIYPLGYGNNHALLPYPKHAHDAYRLLTEYFAFKQRFLFIDIQGLEADALAECDQQLHLQFEFDTHIANLNNAVQTSSLLLGCTPSINLFETQADPISLTTQQSTYPVNVNSYSNINYYEIYRIQSMACFDSNQQHIQVRPLFALKHADVSNQDGIYWQSTRHNLWQKYQQHISGNEMMVNLIKPQQNRSANQQLLLQSNVLCSNRDLPSTLPFSADAPQWRLWNHADENIASIRSITPATASLYPKLDDKQSWQLVSLLALNHLSLDTQEQQCHAFKELLYLHCHQQNTEDIQLINCIDDISIQQIVRRHPQDKRLGVCRGLEITISLSDDVINQANWYLFGSVLQHFMSMYSSINSFTELVFTNPQQGEVARWQANFGTRSLL